MEVRAPLRPEKLFSRYERNPILTADRWTQTINAVFNPGATYFDGETLLLVRVEDRTGLSHLCVARSADGLTGWVVEPERAFRPDVHSHAERFGIEDPRITFCEDEYLIAYTAYSTGGPLVSLAATRDWAASTARPRLPVQSDIAWNLVLRSLSQASIFWRRSSGSPPVSSTGTQTSQ
jgi:predicted GH43/DUF377 family glycosyl hydrolase